MKLPPRYGPASTVRRNSRQNRKLENTTEYKHIFPRAHAGMMPPLGGGTVREAGGMANGRRYTIYLGTVFGVSQTEEIAQVKAA